MGYLTWINILSDSVSDSQLPSRAYVHNWLLKEFMWMLVFQWIKLLKNLHGWKKFCIQTETSLIYSVQICYSSMYYSWKWQDKKFNFGGEKSAVKTVLPFIKTAVIELGTCVGQLCLGILLFTGHNYNKCPQLWMISPMDM